MGGASIGIEHGAVGMEKEGATLLAGPGRYGPARARAPHPDAQRPAPRRRRVARKITTETTDGARAAMSMVHSSPS